MQRGTLRQSFNKAGALQILRRWALSNESRREKGFLYATSDMYVRGKTYIHTYLYGERLDCRVGRPSRSSSASHGCTEMKDV